MEEQTKKRRPRRKILPRTVSEDVELLHLCNKIGFIINKSGNFYKLFEVKPRIVFYCEIKPVKKRDGFICWHLSSAEISDKSFPMIWTVFENTSDLIEILTKNFDI